MFALKALDVPDARQVTESLTDLVPSHVLSSARPPSGENAPLPRESRRTVGKIIPPNIRISGLHQGHG